MVAPTGYILIWSDEFNGTILDTTKWFKSSGTCDYANLKPTNVSLDGNSNVVFTCSDANSGGGIASACDNTGTVRFDFTYGYIEVRAKLADTNQITGIGSDIWLNGSSHWPPEIDITETGSGPMNQDSGINQVNSTLWYGTSSNATQIENHSYIKDANGNPVNLGKGFHIYGMEWTPSFVRYLLDDIEIARVVTHIPNAPMYINTSIYPGGFLGSVQPNTPFPTYMYVDYVRVYQKVGPTQTLGSIGVSPTSANVNIGNTVKLSASCKDQSGVAMTCPVLQWSSDNISVATVDSNGLVNGIAIGIANIITSSGTINSNVSNITVASVSVLDQIQVSLSIKVGTTKQLAAKCFDKNNNTIACPVLVWTSDNISVATVNSTGMVKGITKGTANITVSASGITGNKFIVTVM